MKQGVLRGRIKQLAVPLCAMLAATMLTIAAMACSSAEEPEPAPTAAAAAQPTAPVAQPTQAAAAQPTAAPAQPTAPPVQTVSIKRGGTLRSLAPGPPAALDPGMGNYWVACQLNQTYGKLLEYRAQTYNDPELVPSLAESWEVRDGGQTIQLNLNPNVRWQNIEPVGGRPFVAQDVAWNIEWYGENSSQKWLWEPVSSYEVVDEHTIVLKLDKPSARFFGDLASPWNEMLPRELWERDGNFRSAHIGTGAFLFESFEPEASISRKARPDHWKMGQDGNPLPYVDGWNTVVISDAAARLAALIADQVDLWRCLGGPEYADLDQVRRSLPDASIQSVPRLNYTHIGFDNSKPPFDDPRVRKAAMLAIDPQVVIDAAWDGDGQWSGFIPPSQEDWAWPESTVKEQFARNLDQARALLQQAGYDNVLVESMQYPSGQGGLILHEVIQQMMNEAGFNVELKIVASRSEYSGLQQKGEFGMIISTDTPDADPDGYIGRLFADSSANAETYRISIPELQPLIERVRTEIDPQKRKAAVEEAQELLYQNFPRIPLLTYNVHKVLPAHVKLPNALFWAYGLPGLDEVWLDR